MLTTQQLLNLRSAAVEAVSCEQSVGIPAEYILSQWALESGWGAHSPENNCFGIKWYEGAPGRQLLPTTEWMTYDQCQKWLVSLTGRTATADAHAPSQSEGKIKWHCQDWFASYPNLQGCFEKRASRFSGPDVEKYKQDRNLQELVEASAKIYATDPDYVSYIMKIASMNEVVSILAELRGERKP